MMKCLISIILVFFSTVAWAEQPIDTLLPMGCGDFQGEDVPAKFIDQVLDFYSQADREYSDCPIPADDLIYEAHHRRGRRYRRGRRHHYPRPAPLGYVCRNGFYFCAMWRPGYLGTPCSCPGFLGYVSLR